MPWALRSKGSGRHWSHEGQWLTILVLVLWTRWPSGWVLVPAALGILMTVAGRIRRRRRALGVVVLLVAVAAAAVAQFRLDGVTRGRSEDRGVRASTISQALEESLSRDLADAEHAIDQVVVDWGVRGGLDPESLGEIRERSPLVALAVYDSLSRPLSWHGVHRGMVPDPVKRADSQKLRRIAEKATKLRRGQ